MMIGTIGLLEFMQPKFAVTTAMCCATRAATSWPTMGGRPARSNTILATGRLFRRFATRRSRRIGLRISGEIEKNAPADANGRPFAGNGKGPPGGPQNNLGPIFAIGSTPRPYGPTRLENLRQALRLQNVAQLGPLRRRTEAHSRPAYQSTSRAARSKRRRARDRQRAPNAILEFFAQAVRRQRIAAGASHGLIDLAGNDFTVEGRHLHFGTEVIVGGKLRSGVGRGMDARQDGPY